MRLSDIAEILAEVDHTDVAPLHIRLRNPLFKGLLSGTAGQTRNSPADYGFDELVRARLLSSLYDCRFSTTELALVNAALNRPPLSGDRHPPSAKVDGGIFYPSALHSIIRGARAGENWTIYVRFMRSQDGELQVNPKVFWADAMSGAPVKGALIDALNGDTHLGTLTVPASDLVSPILAYENRH